MVVAYFGLFLLLKFTSCKLLLDITGRKMRKLLNKIGGYMLKKLLGIIICITLVSSFSAVYAHDGSFTWFGLRRNNTEIEFRSGDAHHDNGRHLGHCEPKHKCHHKKPPKPPKPHKHKKDPKHHRFFKFWD